LIRFPGVANTAAFFRRIVWFSLRQFPMLARSFFGLRVLEVCDYPPNHFLAKEVVFPACRNRVSENVSFDQKAKGLEPARNVPALHILRLGNAGVVHNSRFDSVVVGNSLVLPARIEAGPWALYKGKKPRLVGRIVGQAGDFVALKVSKNPRELQIALYIGTRAPYNWYHWIANALPALYVANEAALEETIPLLLPEEIGNSPQMLESLNIFLGKRPVVWIEQDEYLKVGDLLWAESPVCDGPFSIDPAHRLPLTLHRTSMQGYRDKILNYYSAEVAAFTPIEKVFLARKPHSSRPYNHQEIQDLACHYGFEAVFTESLTFGQQVALFFHAKYVVGASGAAFSGLIFATAGLRALRLLKVSEKYENYFSNLATVGGAQVFDCNSDTPKDQLGPLAFQISEHLFEQAMRTLLDQPPKQPLEEL